MRDCAGWSCQPQRWILSLDRRCQAHRGEIWAADSSSLLSQRAAARRAAVSEVQLTHPIQFDDAGRALVRISLDGKVPAAAVIASLKSTAGVEVTATDLNYRAGVVEAYVPGGSLLSIAGKKGRARGGAVRVRW